MQYAHTRSELQNEMNGEGLCQWLEWDSNYFGCRIAQITVNRLRHDQLELIHSWCTRNGVECLYLLADVADDSTVRLAEDSHFQFVDIRITLEWCLDEQVLEVGGTCHGTIRPWSASDIPMLRAIAGSSHRDSRFYHDAHFPISLCEALYGTWIEKSCNGYADTVLVADLEGLVVGYITCKVIGHDRGQIGLCGVSADAQGAGLGRALVTEALRWFVGRGIKRVTVVTQGRNWKGQRLYQRCRFVTRRVDLWYHKWFSR